MDEFYSPYNYVGNDPIHYIDPDGMCSECGDSGHNTAAGHDDRNSIEKFWDGMSMVWDNWFTDQPEVVKNTVYIITDEHSRIEMMHTMAPDAIQVNIGLNAFIGYGFDVSIEANWITKGRYSSSSPYVGLTGNLGTGWDLGVYSTIGAGYFFGSGDPSPSSLGGHTIGGQLGK